MSESSILTKAELCVAIVRKQYEGKARPSEQTVENRATELMSLPDRTLAKMARKLGIEVPEGFWGKN